MTKVLSLKLTKEQLDQVLEMVKKEEAELCGKKYEGWVGEIDDLRWKLARLNSAKEIRKCIEQIIQKYSKEQSKVENMKLAKLRSQIGTRKYKENPVFRSKIYKQLEKLNLKKG